MLKASLRSTVSVHEPLRRRAASAALSCAMPCAYMSPASTVLTSEGSLASSNPPEGNSSSVDRSTVEYPASAKVCLMEASSKEASAARAGRS